MDISDAVEKVKDGDIESFEIIIDTLQRPILSYCCYLLGNASDAEDVSQDVFILVFRKIHKYQATGSFSSWVYRIAYNQCMNFIRKRKAVRFIPILENIIVKKPKNIKDSTKDLEGILSCLKAVDRSIIIFRLQCEKSFDEIGDILGLKPSNVRKRFERAKKKLSQKYEKCKGGINDEGCII